MSRCRLSKKYELYHARVVKLYYAENVSKEKICDIFPISISTISRWISTFAVTNPEEVREFMERSRESKVVQKSMSDKDAELKSLQSEVERLRKQLEKESLRADLYNEMINVAEKQFDINIRKKAGTKRS